MSHRRNGLHIFLEECLTKALIDLMENEELADISITKLVEAAGVSRGFVHNNFKSKEDILSHHLRGLLREWSDDFKRHGSPARFAESLLCYFYDNKAFYLMLDRQGVSGLLFDAIRWAVRVDDADDVEERYARSAFAGLIFGTVAEWLRHGMRETPEEILRLIPLGLDELACFFPAARVAAFPGA